MSSWGEGYPTDALALIEGASDAGKSVLSQHLAYGALLSDLGVAYFTTENTVKSLLTQMESLCMDVTDRFLIDSLRVYPIHPPAGKSVAGNVFPRLIGHIAALPDDFEVIILDSLTTLVDQVDEASGLLDFVTSCKRLCDQGRTIFVLIHSDVFAEETLIRMRSLCDAHLRLRVEPMGDRLINVLEVKKVRNAIRNTGSIVTFEVEPRPGMRVIPVMKAKPQSRQRGPVSL